MKGMSRAELSVLIKCCICIGCSIGFVSNCIGLFYTPMSEALGTGRGKIAVISTIISLSAAAFGRIVARLIKKFPINYVMTTGALMTVCGLFVLSFAREIPLLYAMAMVIGVGVICFKNLTVSIVLYSWFGEKSASKLGLAMAFSGVTAAFMNPILGKIITASDYGTAMRVLALVIGVFSFPAAFTIRLKEGGAEKSSANAAKSGSDEKTYIPTVLLILMAVCLPISVSGATGMNTHFSSYVVTLGYSLGFGATVVSFQSIFNSVWKLVYGFLADRIGPIRSCLVYVGLSITSCVLLITLTRLPAGIIMGVSLYPVAFSISTVGMPTIIMKVAKERYAEVYATANMVQAISYATMTSVYGVISDKAGNYIPCIMMVFCFALLCGTTCLIIRKKEKGVLD